MMTGKNDYGPVEIGIGTRETGWKRTADMISPEIWWNFSADQTQMT